MELLSCVTAQRELWFYFIFGDSVFRVWLGVKQLGLTCLTSESSVLYMQIIGTWSVYSCALFIFQCLFLLYVMENLQC